MRYIISFLFLFCCLQGIAQNVGIGTNTPAVSAQLEISSVTKGLLIPRLTAAQKNLIVSPATGLLIYLTDSTQGFYYFDGTIWSQLQSGIVPLSNGGTGSSVKNFVDLTTNQTINGSKIGRAHV